MTLDEFGERLTRLEEERKTAREELEALRGRREALEVLERDRYTLLKNYANLLPEALDAFSPEERHRVYQMLRLKVTTNPAGGIMELAGVLRETANVLGTEAEVSETKITRSSTDTVNP